MNKKKRVMSVFCMLLLLVGLLAGCGKSDDSKITVLTREEGSGTRGAFIELFGIEAKNEDGTKTDRTIAEAEQTSSTTVMMTSVEGNASAIGYVSLGSLNGAGEDAAGIKPVKIEGVEATVENIKNGSYKVARPFHLATAENPSELAADFLSYVMSAEGQAIVEENGYISQGNNGAYAGKQISGKLTVGGSSSVTPVMNKLAEAYQKVNPNAEVIVTQNDSTSGMTGTIDGVYDIGMASRDLKSSELEAGLQPTLLAMDGIAVIVNKDNEVENLTIEQVMNIYIGEITSWDELE